MEWTSVISEMQYPHWLIVAGSALVAVGYVGSIFQWNAGSDGQEMAPPEKRSRSRSPSARKSLPLPPFLLDSRD
jgi:hypothetical protein